MQNIHPVTHPTQQVTRKPFSYPLNLPALYCKPTVMSLTKKEKLTGEKETGREIEGKLESYSYVLERGFLSVLPPRKPIGC